ncbi:MAG: cell division protein FtsK [Phycisphaerae bacterium]|nr:cell division protein FtsK [Phycisphaerae bacterium]
MTDPEHNPTIEAMDSKTNRSPLASLDDSIDFIVSGSEDRARRDRESRTHNDQQIAEEAELHRATVAGIKIAFEKSTRTENQTRETDLETENGGYETAVKELHRNHRSKRKRIEEHAQSRITEMKQRLDEATWLAEAVFEASETTPRENFEKLREKVETRTLELEEVCELARVEVRRYRQKPHEGPQPSQERTDRISSDPEAVFAEATHQTVDSLNRLKALKFARILRGGVPFLIIMVCGGLGALVGWSLDGSVEPAAMLPEIGIGLIIGTALMAGCWLAGRKHVHSCWAPMATSIQDTRMAAELLIEKARRVQRDIEDNAIHVRERDIKKAKDKYLPLIEDSRREQETLLNDLEFKFPEKAERLEREHEQRLRTIERTWADGTSSAREVFDEANEAERSRHETRLAELKSQFDATQEDIRIDWHKGMNRAQAVFEDLITRTSENHPSFESDRWTSWNPASELPGIIPFGSVALDRNEIPDALPTEERFAHELPESISLPAFLSFPDTCSLIIESDTETRPQSLGVIRALMTRLLATMPPSKLRFTILDPVGLGEAFAGFMHLVDHDEKLINDRIWTETRHIEQRLLDITEHMETVIQKYLRNEFDSIIDYNEAAGEVAEPLRFLIVSDFPANFTDVACKRLASIATSGPKCGVYLILMRDLKREMPESIDLEMLHAHAVHAIGRNGSWHLERNHLERFPLTCDAEPSEDLITDVARRVGEASVKADKVEVPFEMIAPKPDQYWTGSSQRNLAVNLGRSGATKLQQLILGVGTAQHALIAGKTGSGKSTLLHALITNLACWYSPDEVEFWLVDFKKGVEFKTYATHNLPHARAVAVESDREFGVSVLKGLDDELKRRGDLYRSHGVQDLAGFRDLDNGQSMPRVLLIVDEFQELFVEDDKISQEASLLLDRLVRQGRAFGMHVVLGSQTLAGAYSLARSTMGQMGVRIALQCSESDSQVILSDDNSAARLLSRPGEAIYNDQSGLIEGNSPFQVCWLDDTVRDECLDRVETLTRSHGIKPETIVFEGSKPARLQNNMLLEQAIRSTPDEKVLRTEAWLGDAIAIKDPTAATFRRQTGANLLVVGQQDEASVAVSYAAMLSLAAMHRKDDAQFTILDGTPADDPAHGMLAELANALPHVTTLPGFHDVESAMEDLGRTLARRTEGAITDAPAHYLIIHGLQRFRVLRRNENDFGFGSDDDTPPTPDKILASILREGPMHGMHTIAWCDTVSSLQRAVDRQGIGEFDQRALFQVSATDSSTLIDSPAGGRLGFNRSLLYSEERGTIEKFRPWELPDRNWGLEMAALISRRER